MSGKTATHIVHTLALSSHLLATQLANMAFSLFFFLNDPATTEISPLPLHDALPICGTPRGAGGGSRSIPGIARRAESLVEGVGAGAEFRRVGFGVDPPAIAFEMLDQKVGTGRDVILVDGRALRGQDSRNIGEVLDRNRHAREQPALACRFFHQRLGVGSG